MSKARQPAVRIRRARPEEAGEIASVWLRSRAASAPAIPPLVHTEDEVHRWFEDVLLPNDEVWIAEDPLSIVGILVLEGAWVDQLYVHPDRTGQGIGAQLISTAKQERPTGLRLWTFAANVRARRFYEDHSFVVTGSTTGDNEECAPDVLYEWRPIAAP